MTQRLVLIAGGVGGAKAAEGLAQAAAERGDHLQIIGNVADDDTFYGLQVSPDIDTLLYSLSQRVNRSQGWGLAGDSNRLQQQLALLGASHWMKLGDLDLATHLYRTQRQQQGDRTSDITHSLAVSLGVTTPVLLPTDDDLRTWIKTSEGWLRFQEFFVRERCQPAVEAIEIRGLETAQATPEAIAALEQADVILLAPSNPLVSIDPILKVPGIQQAITRSAARCIAISPLIGGQPIKGPLDKMLKALHLPCNNIGVAQHYQQTYPGLLNALVIDHQDHIDQQAIQAQGIVTFITDTLMTCQADKVHLMQQCLRWMDLLTTTPRSITCSTPPYASQTGAAPC
ncbi:2-phospho-L-lactate transferase [Terasakiispira papahanaumokuakeensis]|uniref:2-phospho-L-lactate transferase n=1 Tax=Terasakiispira papahanaumokuakeensis TaxID=197479 RepID=A0A1E2VBG7_9GAMM|nr:2-phospho-L-lactate transferase [Terasakiispira papahanaumokuakeensis]ODC04314.1 2-phospho-L-lactate transferase [Terasakiispira papahanaumokuakeensis]